MTTYNLKVPQSIREKLAETYLSFELLIYEGNSALLVGCKKEMEEMGSFEW